MPSLARALALRAFGTKRLAAASTLRLLGLGVLVYTLPGVFAFVGLKLYEFIYFSLASIVFYLFTFIVPLLVLLADLVLLPGFIILFFRGYTRLAIYYVNWFRQLYFLAQADTRLHSLFTEER